MVQFVVLKNTYLSNILMKELCDILKLLDTENDPSMYVRAGTDAKMLRESKLRGVLTRISLDN